MSLLLKIFKKYIGYIIVSISIFLLSWNISISINNPSTLLKYENKQLIKKNKILKAKNRKLITKQKIITKKIQQHRKKTVSKLINRSKNKLATAPAKMVPLLGVATIIAMTTYDIKAYCQDINDIKSLETTLFGDIKSDDMIVEIDEICNLDIEKKLKPILGDKYKSIKDDFKGSIKWIEDNTKSSFEALERLFQ